MNKSDGSVAPSPEEVTQAGGDWSGYGELTGQQFIALLQANKISFVLADKGVIMAVENSQGQVGTYNFQHVPSF